MSILHIAESVNIGNDNSGNAVQAFAVGAPFNATNSQTVTFAAGANTPAARANAGGTRVVWLMADAACKVNFGAAASATAGLPIPGNVPVCVTVPRGTTINVWGL